MIDRENLIYIKNILSLNNHDIDLDVVYKILTAIKESDEFAFYTTLLTHTNPNIDTGLLTLVLQTIKQHQKLSNEIFDSFSKNQIKEKIKLLELIDSLNMLDTDSEVIIFGSWFGSIFIPTLSPKVKKITAIDLDNNVIKIAKNQLFPNYTNVDYIPSDIFSQDRGRYHTAKLFINTSCEHMMPMNTWPYWNNVNKNSYFAFISNNMDYVNGHINCVYSVDQFKTQLPKNFTVLNETEIVEERGTKYLLVGKISS